MLPRGIWRRIFGKEEEEEEEEEGKGEKKKKKKTTISNKWTREVEGELEVWGDGWMNRHLGYRILELVVVRVLPEMGEKGVKELMEGRGG